ncbi:PREDICTED: mitochondrial fission process protein 1 [Dufourea novaeangliae]|uniref:Mitochondrial fission process protein 1 n=1 Tax=Dufourea novaeangliae TaxID=178035 RepID=A0A154PL85_DUFNO|nr:PREDICTED: mitochondrial fission process protein 1 [Dufourea novaeangliae]KZC12593.1 Mitochondrial fission process protein 1 [Dufourea novaeangliae]
MTDKKPEEDVFRDTPVRYLGYANEVGEAFRPIVSPSIVWLSYVISSGYVIADTVHKGWKEYEGNTSKEATKNALYSMADTLLWQTFASVLIPGFMINRICAATQCLQRKSCNPVIRNRWMSTVIGLVSIPLIIQPIDHIVDEAMNVTYRKWVGYYPK